MSLITEIRDDLHSAHLRAQVGRVARITALALAAQMTALGTAHLDRQALVGVGVGALEAVYRQLVPTVGWSAAARAIADRLHLLGATPTAAVTTPDPVAPTANSSATAPDAVPGSGA